MASIQGQSLRGGWLVVLMVLGVHYENTLHCIEGCRGAKWRVIISGEGCVNRDDDLYLYWSHGLACGGSEVHVVWEVMRLRLP